MTKLSTQPPSGMRDFLPSDVQRRRYVIGVIQEVYESHGFLPLETPTIENLSTLVGKYGDEGDQLLYRLLHRRDALRRACEGAANENRAATQEELANEGLRYDLTVPLARVVAQYGELPRFFKRYQIQPVWRADRPGKGRFREFYQCDVDITGVQSLVAEAEVCTAVARVLERLGFDDFVVHVNHRELLRAIVRASGIENDKESTALVAVDKLDKLGKDGVLRELEDRGVSSSSGLRLLHSIAVDGDNQQILDQLRGMVDEVGGAALDSLATLLAQCNELPVHKRMKINPSLARGLSYYTGPIFEIQVPDLAGSLGGGGRYDGLIGIFGKREIPAVGFSLGLERILAVMHDREMFPDIRIGPDLMLCWLGISESTLLSVANRIRQQGLRVEVYPDADKLKKQLQYADADGVKAEFAAIVGESEVQADTVALKHLATGEQVSVPVDKVFEHLQSQKKRVDMPN